MIGGDKSRNNARHESSPPTTIKGFRAILRNRSSANCLACNCQQPHLVRFSASLQSSANGSINHAKVLEMLSIIIDVNSLQTRSTWEFNRLENSITSWKSFKCSRNSFSLFIVGISRLTASITDAYGDSIMAILIDFCISCSAARTKEPVRRLNSDL